MALSRRRSRAQDLWAGYVHYLRGLFPIPGATRRSALEPIILADPQRECTTREEARLIDRSEPLAASPFSSPSLSLSLSFSVLFSTNLSERRDICTGRRPRCRSREIAKPRIVYVHLRKKASLTRARTHLALAKPDKRDRVLRTTATAAKRTSLSLFPVPRQMRSFAAARRVKTDRRNFSSAFAAHLGHISPINR